MNQFSSIFSQLLQLFPRFEFQHLVKMTQPEKECEPLRNLPILYDALNSSFLRRKKFWSSLRIIRTWEQPRLLPSIRIDDRWNCCMK